jgi:hypothetical protein
VRLSIVWSTTTPSANTAKITMAIAAAWPSAIGRRDSSTTAPLRRCSPSATANSQPIAGLTPWKNPSPASATQGHRLLIAQRIGPSFRPSAPD